MLGDKTNDELTEEIGRRIRRIRLRRNMTQQRLATKAGIGRLAVARAEEGSIKSVRVLLAIARALGHLGDFDLLFDVPDVSPREIALLKGKRRIRASGTRARRKKGTPAP